jgi:hypothetical protein
MIHPNSYYPPNQYNAPHPYYGYGVPQPMSYSSAPYPYPAPQQQIPMPAPMRQYNKNLTYSFRSDGDKRSLILHNVDMPSHLHLKSKTLPFKRNSPNNNGDMAFDFIPDGGKHVISIYNNNDRKFKFTLKPKTPEVIFLKNGERKFIVKDIYDPKHIILSSDNKIDWSYNKCDKYPNSYYINFNAHQQVANIKLKTRVNGEETPIKNGNITLSPLRPKMYSAPAPQPYQYPMYAPPPMAYNMPPPMYASQPMQPPMYQAPRQQLPMYPAPNNNAPIRTSRSVTNTSI